MMDYVQTLPDEKLAHCALHRDRYRAEKMNFAQNDDLYSAVLRLNRRLSRKINAALKIHELTGEQAVVLETIAALDCLRVTDLCIALGLDPSTESVNLKPLLKRQFVVITEGVVDRRVRRVKLTPEGEMRLRSSRKIPNTMDEAIKQKLAAHGVPEEVVAALRMLS